MSSMKKYIAEFIGTMVLVTLGCGTAMLVGCDAQNGGGYILTALAFGLVIVGMAYSIGNISGCHINPAVSLAVFLTGGMSSSEFGGYVVAQCFGSLVGSGILAAIFSLGGVLDQTGGFGSNGLAGVNGSIAAGLLTEIVLTCIFVITILGVTSKKANHGSFAGLVIGLTLTLVHILGIGLTGTSVNPARSIGPAVASAINGNAEPLKSLVVFIVGPFLGAALAALIYKYLESPETAPAAKPDTPVQKPAAPAQKPAAPAQNPAASAEKQAAPAKKTADKKEAPSKHDAQIKTDAPEKQGFSEIKKAVENSIDIDIDSDFKPKKAPTKPLSAVKKKSDDGQ